MRILFALPGLHRVDRGAEIAFISVARELAKMGHEVTLTGSGPPRPSEPYAYRQASAIRRERFESLPELPLLRGETSWEDATFVPGLLRAYRPRDFDVTLTCSYPFTSWALRRPTFGKKRPPHVFVTQNGDWPAFSNDAEYRFFGCEGLICINPDFYERNHRRYRAAVIPNGVDVDRFTPGPSERALFGLPDGRPIVLMVSAFIASKNIAEGIQAVSELPDAVLLVAGDGPLRDEYQALADEKLPGRYRRLSVSSDEMPALYRSADVFLHLSRDESFGNVFVEAMACGIPTVAYDLPRTRWIVADTAFLADPDEPASLTKQLETALASPHPPATVRKHSKQFAWPSIAAQYETFLQQVVDQS